MLWIHGAVRRGGALIVERCATQGSIPCLSNSTAKIKHCYGVMAGALMAAGNQIHRDTLRNDAKPLQSEFLPNGG